MNKQAYALVTGGSMGFGREMSFELAQRGYPLILVALDTPELEQSAQDVRDKYGVDVKTYATDLTKEDNIEALHQWYLQQNVELDVLVNNAGFGRQGYFHNMDRAMVSTMVKLNNLAMMLVAHTFIPELRKRPKSWLLIVGSMESFLAMPYKTLYTATKHFNMGFAMGLREELKTSNVSVSILCPGPSPTHPDSRKRLENSGLGGKLVGMMPEDIARIAIKGLFKGKRYIIPGGFTKFAKNLGMAFPLGIRMTLMEKAFRYLVKDEKP